MKVHESVRSGQDQRNAALLAATPFVGPRFESHVLPFGLDLNQNGLTDQQAVTLAALEKKAAVVAIQALASLAKVNDIDHLGGGLEIIPPLLMTLSIVDYEGRHFTVEHAHTSIGYYAALATLGFLPESRVVDGFRRSLDIAGHVCWVPGGTQLNGGRLGVMVPAAVGQSLGLKARLGDESLVICHCGDAGWVSGQALNGFVAASVHRAPVVFVMNRNGIQLSGTTARIMPKDPRSIIESIGIRLLEVPSLHDRAALFGAYTEACHLARSGQPALIYPVGYRSSGSSRVTLRLFGDMYGITPSVEHLAAKHKVAMDTEVWIPGSLMSFRDGHAMTECLFYVNNLPGGEGHHDGGMKGRDVAVVLANPMLQLTAAEASALETLQRQPPRVVITAARPARGSKNLILSQDEAASVELPGPDKSVSPRVGSEAGYVALAKRYPDHCFFVSCDLDPSTRLGKAASCVPPGHRFEMGIQEQAASLLANGLSTSSREPQLNVFATFGAFFEGIAREGFELWRYQRNLTGSNEGLNVTMHLSHVGACTGRDHFSGWSLDWINLALAYLPYLRRFYAPADARAAFIAVRDAASAYGGHIVAIPRDNLPILNRQGTMEPLWRTTDTWEPVTRLRQHDAASTAILALGAPSFLAGQAADEVVTQGVPVDVSVINGFPIPPTFWDEVANRYKRILTIEDGLIGNTRNGLRGFAGLAASSLFSSGVRLKHFGITDPSVAPSDHFLQVWEHFQISQEPLVQTILQQDW